MPGNPSFDMPGSGWLRRHGVEGDATVSLMPNGVRIAGKKGGLLTVYSTQVERVQTGWQSVKSGPFFETLVWLRSEDKPLKLWWRGRAPEAYAAVIRGLGEQVARRDLAGLWRGTSRFSALGLLVPMTALLLAAAAIGLFALADDEWWQRMVPVLIPAAMVLVGIAELRRQWPRPATSLEDFNSQITLARRRR